MAGNSCGFTVACSYYFQTASAINHTSPEVTTKKTRPCECKHIPTATTEGTKFLGMKEAAFDIESRVQPALGVLCSGTGEHCSLNKFLHKELSKKQNHSLLMVSFPHPTPMVFIMTTFLIITFLSNSELLHWIKSVAYLVQVSYVATMGSARF